MKWVSIKEARLLDQWLHTTIASVTWRDLINFLGKDMAAINIAVEELDNSELYKTIGKDIEGKAQELVETKCKPEWDKISEEMKPLGEERNKLAKEKAEVPEDWVWETAKEERLAEIDKQLSELSQQYQKITDEANAELNEYKEKRINEEQGAAFILEDAIYELVSWYAWF